jgi:transcriptional activator of cad operon
MTLSDSARLQVGDWDVDPVAGQISRGSEDVRLDARTMRLLLELASRPGEVVSIDHLLVRVWSGVTVTPDSVYQAVASLRRILGDDPRRPRYIATVPRLGYRLVAKVSPGVDASLPPPPGRRLPIKVGSIVAVVLVVAGVILAYSIWRGEVVADALATQRSVGVAPFVDLTPSMDQDQLADDMTQGLADRLSRNPALKTPGFRSSYFLIGKHVSVADASRALGVAYVVDGSVRKSGDQVQVAARLVRARGGLLVWSKTYDRPFSQLPAIQAEIASEVGAALEPDAFGRNRSKG